MEIEKTTTRKQTKKEIALDILDLYDRALVEAADTIGLMSSPATLWLSILLGQGPLKTSGFSGFVTNPTRGA